MKASYKDIGKRTCNALTVTQLYLFHTYSLECLKYGIMTIITSIYTLLYLGTLL